MTAERGGDLVVADVGRELGFYKRRQLRHELGGSFHAPAAIHSDDDDDGRAVPTRGFQFLDVEADRAIARNQIDRAVRRGQLGADGVR